MPLKHIFNRITPMFFLDPNDPPGGGDPPNNDGSTTDPEENNDDKQKALDKQFAERADRAAKAEREKLLKELGVTDPEEAKKLLEAARKADEAKQSELEKEQAARQKAERAAEEAMNASEKVLADANTRLMNSEIKIAAASPIVDKDGKVTRPAFRKEALDDLLLLIKRDDIKETDGKFEGVEKALADLAKSKPYLLVEDKQAPGPGTPPGPRKPRDKQAANGERTPIVNSL